MPISSAYRALFGARSVSRPWSLSLPVDLADHSRLLPGAARPAVAPASARLLRGRSGRASFTHEAAFTLVPQASVQAVDVRALRREPLAAAYAALREWRIAFNKARAVIVAAAQPG